MAAIVSKVKSVEKVSLHVKYERVLISGIEVDVREGLFKVDDLAIVISANSSIPQWLITKYDLYYNIRNYGGHLTPQPNISRCHIVIPLIPCQVFVPRWRFVDDRGTEHVVQEGEDVSSILGIE